MDSNNKEDIFNTLVSKAKEIKLSERERTTLFQTVDAFVARNPIKEQTSAEPQYNPQPIKSPFFKQDWFFAFSQRSHNYYAAMALTIVAIFGTGTSFASQSSLPGDILYPVKVNILEEVKAVFLPTTLKPTYEIERAQTRIKEVKELAQQNRLSDDVKVSVAARIDNHISTVKKDITEFQEKGDLKHVLAISNSLESALSESEEQIETLEEGEDASKIAFVKDIIQESKEDAVKDREVIEDEIYTRQINDDKTFEIAKARFDATQKVLKSLENKMEKIAVSDTNVMSVDDSVSTGIVSDEVALLQTMSLSVSTADNPEVSANAKIAAPQTVELSLDDLVLQARELLTQGEEKMKNKEYTEAFRIFREASYVTQIIEFQLGQSTDIGAELESLLNDINFADSEIEADTKAETAAVINAQN